MLKTSSELCDTYFQAIRKTSPKSYEIYKLFGKGDPVRGYDIVNDLKLKYINELTELYFHIKESDIRFIDIDRYIYAMHRDKFKTLRSVRGTIWARLFTSQGFKKAETIYRLYLVKEIVKKYIKHKEKR
jgi:hypothetical protein